MVNNISLKPYLDEIKNICDELSQDKLENFIIEIAKDIPLKERNKFLKKLKNYSVGKPEISTGNQNMTLNRIQELKEEIIERQKSIDDGSYYDDLDYDDYDEESPDTISEEQKNELEHLFYDADKLFLANKTNEAKDIYQALINMFEISDTEEEWLDLGLQEIDIDWKETLARYCRCVYETSLSENRVNNVTQSLKINLTQFERDFKPEDEIYPFLQDIYDAKADEPLEWKDFLNNLKLALKGKTSNRAFVLFLEATDKTDGLNKVEDEVKKYRVSAGYLYLLDRLVKNQSWEKTSNIAQEAIINISDNLRLNASEILVLASEKLENQELLLKGKREVFFSAPNNTTLHLFLEEAKKQGYRKEELEKIMSFLSRKSNLTALKIEAMLMLGQLNNALEIVKKGSNLGWSHREEIGLSFAGILIALSDANSNAEIQKELLKNYLDSTFSYFRYDKKSDEQEFICKEIYEGLKNIVFNDPYRQEIIVMAENLGKSRIDGIVSNQHRGAYKRAAEVLGSMAEYYVIKNDKQKAIALITEFKNQKYKRYPAFKKEVDSMIKNSALLKSLNKL